MQRASIIPERDVYRLVMRSKLESAERFEEWVAYAQHLDAGRFEVKTGTAERNNHAFAKTVFTPKGVQWIAGEWGKHQAEKELNCQVPAMQETPYTYAQRRDASHPALYLPGLKAEVSRAN